MELTILMPCLNEEQTIGKCIKKADEFIKKNNIDAEILIADNGSTDNSVKIAEELGARVITVQDKGYGNVLRAGTKEAKGTFVIMGDCDDSYNFLEIADFLERLKQGYDLVIGNRYKGKMEKGSMKFTHKYIGTPIISYLARKKFKIQVRDFNCGLRGYRNKAILDLECTSESMEYASEMIIKAQKANLKIIEIPINFYKDGRNKKSHMKAIKEGINHIKLIFCE